MENKLLKIEAIRFGLRSTFGDQDKIFNSHKLDENRSKKIRTEAKKLNISLDWIEEMYLGYMFRCNCSKEHIDEQMKKIHNFYKQNLSIINSLENKEIIESWQKIIN
jgi:hypothetical protein